MTFFQRILILAVSTLFIQITPEITNYTIASNLTKMQYRVWLYLYHLDPFGDRTISIPQPRELATTLNMSVRSIYRAFSKLTQLGLFRIASSYQRIITNGVKNQPLGTKKPRKRHSSVSANFGNVDDKTGTTVTERSRPCQNWQNRSAKANNINNFKASQTNSDLKKTYSDLRGEQETLGNNNQEEIIDFWAEDDIDSSTLVENKFIDDRSLSRDVEQTSEKPKSDVVNSTNQTASIDKLEREQTNDFTPSDRPDSKLDRRDRDRPIIAEIVEDRSITNNDDRQIENKKLQPIDLRLPTSLSWLPNGPWKVDGKLDPHFRDWLAKDWLNRYGGTIHQKRADVLSHFKKDPANLPIRWEQYQSEYLDRFRNAKTRLDNGLAIAPDEQQRLKDNAAAVSKSIPPADSIVANKKVLPPLRRSDKLSNSNNAKKENSFSEPIDLKTLNKTNPSRTNYSIDLSSIPDNEAKPYNIAAYQYHQPKPIENMADPKQVAEVVRGFLTKFKSTPKPDRSNDSDKSQLSKLNSWLQDPILYSEAVKRAKSAGYHLEYSRAGVAIKISEPEF